MHPTLALIVALACLPAPAQPLPEALARPVTQTLHGVTVSDPLRGLERIQDPDVLNWMRAQDAAARRSLAALTARAALRERVAALDAAGSDAVTRVHRTPDGRLFYLLRRVGDEQYRLVVQADDDTAPRLLADPMLLAGVPGVPHAITRFQPSPQGHRVGVVVSPAGSEQGTLHVLDVDSARPLMPPMDRADWALPFWIDKDRFLVPRLQALAPGQDRRDKYRRVGIDLVHLPGAAGGARHVELPLRRWSDPALDDDTVAVIRPLPGSAQALLTAVRGVDSEAALYLGDLAQVEEPAARWTLLAGTEAGVVDFSVHGRTLYAITHRQAPRRRVVAWDLDRPTAPPREVLPASERVVLRIVATRDALVVLVRDGNVHRLLQIAHGAQGRAAAPREVALPLAGQVFVDAGWARDIQAQVQDGLVIGLQGWTRGLAYHVVAPDGSVRPLGLPRLSDADAPGGLASTELLVRSHDGELVPMSLVHRADLGPDRRHPVWLQAYASYGMTIDPHYRREHLAWLERGGVLAFVNPRGSGVYGQDWYLAGKGPTKPNTWLDVIACAEHLIRSGWTSPSRLAFSGRSAGGMLAGRLLTARPDLFAAVVAGVGVHDMLRAEFEPNGPPNIPEFGSVATREGFHALRAMSPYANVVDGTAYPAVLLTHGINDPRVAAWHSAKMAARLQAATSTGAPVLLRLDFDAGHGVGNTRAQQLDEAADTMAFLWAYTSTRR